MTSLSRRAVMTGALGTAALLASGSMFSKALAQTGAKGGILNIPLGEPQLLCSGVTSQIAVCIISSKMFEGLLAYDTDLKPVPEMAESWEFAEDGKTMTFKLRDGLRWHDGKDVTSADVKFSAEKLWLKYLPRAKGNFADLVSIDASDPKVVVFKFSKPAFSAQMFMNSVEAPIMPAHVYDVEGDVTKIPAMRAPVGSGPFKFKAWEAARFIELERNADYWNKDLPLLDGIVVVISSDRAANAAKLESGEVNYAVFSSVPSADVERLRANPELAVTTDGYNYLGYVQAMEVNSRKGPLADKRVRQAIRAAIDVNFYVDTVYFGFGKPSLGMLPTSSPWRNTSIPDFAFDLDKANKLLDEAGFARGANGERFEIGLLYNGASNDPRGPEYLRQALAKAGIKLRLEPNEIAVYLSRIYTANDFDLTINNLFLFNDPALGMQRFLLEAQLAPGLNFGNAGGWFSKELSEKFIEAKTLPGEDARKTAFNEIQTVLADEMPMIYLFEHQSITVSAANLKDHIITDPAPYGGLSKAHLA
jgi:peptide/nickel transport system substrate-binding protein